MVQLTDTDSGTDTGGESEACSCNSDGVASTIVDVAERVATLLDPFALILTAAVQALTAFQLTRKL
ncbi:hypothetical protein [Halostella salina]|uniref:hypothetical protein n=1 Tax=Halostella salina TaxID=1547897 RepID=UPI000EF76BB0|nr:hypothetical protein [Halostella salina]